MPTFEITAPDGKTYEVSGSGTKEQALAHFQSTWKPGGGLEPTASAIPPANTAKPVGEDTGINRAKRYALGAVQGAVLDPLAAVGQFLPENYGGNLANRQLAWYENKRRELGGTGFDPSRLAGNVAGSFVPIVGAAGKLGQGVKGAGLFKKGAIAGAATGALQPVLPSETGEEKSFLGEKALQIGGGALLGGGINKLIGKATSAQLPKAAKDLTTAEIQALNPTQKVAAYRELFPEANLTLGQLLGPQANKWEQRATSMPFVGDTIAAAREKALQSQNVAMMKNALEPAGIKLNPDVVAGRGLFGAAKAELTKQYDHLLKDTHLSDPQALRAKIYGSMNTGTGPGLATPAQLANAYKPGVISSDYNRLSEAGQKRFDKIMEESLFSKFGKDPQGNYSRAMSGDQFKRHEEDLKDVIGDLMAGGGEDRMIGRMIKNSLGEAYQSLTSSKPGVTDQLKNLNKAYANYKTLSQASTASAQSGGMFNPLQTIKAAGARNRDAIAQGRGLLQPQAELSQDVLGRVVPDSGTAGRLNQGNIFKGLVGGAIDIPLSMVYHPAVATKLVGGTQKGFNRFENTRLGRELANRSGQYTGSGIRALFGPSGPTEEPEQYYAQGGYTGPLSRPFADLSPGPLTILRG